MKERHVLLGSQAVVSLVLERELQNEPVSLVAEEVQKHCRFFLNETKADFVYVIYV